MSKRKLKGVADATRASLSQVEVVESEEKELYAHVRAYIASARETVYAVANSAESGPGSGYTRSNLRTMRQFYLMFPICHAVSGKLT